MQLVQISSKTEPPTWLGVFYRQQKKGLQMQPLYRLSGDNARLSG